MGVVSGVKQLALRQTRVRPVAGAGFFGFLQPLSKKMCDRDFRAHSSPVPCTPQNLTQINDIDQLDPQP